MTRRTLALLAPAGLALVLVAAATDPGPQRLAYDVVDLKGKLWLETETEPNRLEVGDRAESGDRLGTGSSSRAELGVASHATRFLLGPKTRCTLAHGRPGVLLHLERGRLHAVFDPYPGSDPRLVTTPSAVLAVRGTEYGLEVDKKGRTHVVVFAGVVEVADPAGAQPPVRVEAGQQTRAAGGEPPETPTPHRIAPQDWDRGRTAPPPGMTEGGFDPGMQGGDPGAPGAGAGQGAEQGGSKRRGG